MSESQRKKSTVSREKEDKGRIFSAIIIIVIFEFIAIFFTTNFLLSHSLVLFVLAMYVIVFLGYMLINFSIYGITSNEIISAILVVEFIGMAISPNTSFIQGIVSFIIKVGLGLLAFYLNKSFFEVS